MAGWEVDPGLSFEQNRAYSRRALSPFFGSTMTIVTIPGVNRTVSLDSKTLLRQARATIWQHRWAQILTLALMALPLGWLAGSAGFAKGGSLTINLMIIAAIMVALKLFVKTVWFWWAIWGVAAIIWASNLIHFLMQARHILATPSF